jgi:hypothetical protein
MFRSRDQEISTGDRNVRGVSVTKVAGHPTTTAPRRLTLFHSDRFPLVVWLPNHPQYADGVPRGGAADCDMPDSCPRLASGVDGRACRPRTHRPAWRWLIVSGSVIVTLGARHRLVRTVLIDVYEPDSALVQLFGYAPTELFPWKMREGRPHSIVVLDRTRSCRRHVSGELGCVGAAGLRKALTRASCKLAQRGFYALWPGATSPSRSRKIREQ